MTKRPKRALLGPPKVRASFGPETHTRLTRDEGSSFSGLDASAPVSLFTTGRPKPPKVSHRAIFRAA
jgi:hypothetical protein